MRLSNTKKKAKVEKAKEGKRGGGGGDDDAFKGAGGVSPQQRVAAAKHEARRWLGQHFLIDHGVILDAVQAAGVQPGDRILEIGPGTGNLTVELLRAGASITAVEKDRSLADKLQEQFEGEGNLEVFEADFLKWNVVESFRDVTEAVAATAAAVEGGGGGASNGDGVDDAVAVAAPRDGRAKVVANIPYNITTDILKTLLPMGDTFSNMVFMFQVGARQRQCLYVDSPEFKWNAPVLMNPK
jgi:16S rRNA A1518/A1519 N6-dimethyltransferase RsmA/KsgA/DIM1 with predicted DNA glycosylase/AP lyase activity